MALTLGLGLGALIQGHRSRLSNEELVISMSQAVRGEVVNFRRAVLGPVPANPADKEARRVRAAVAYADVLNTGETMLLVIHGSGMRRTTLRVFGWRLYDFQEIAKPGTSMPQSFTVGDLDGDGRTEIATLDVDFERRRPDGQRYAMVDGLRRELLYRWDGDEFSIVGEHKLPIPSEDSTPWEFRWHLNPIEIPYEVTPYTPRSAVRRVGQRARAMIRHLRSE